MLKPLLFILILISLTLTSCEKEDDINTYKPIPNEGY